MVESGFTGFRGFFSVGHWFKMVRAAAKGLNQDFQDFED
jgi:hypothetical protein